MIVNRFYNWRIRNRFSCPGSDKYEKKKKQEKRWVNPSRCFSSDEISIINDHICAKFERSKMSANYEEIFCPFVVMIVVVVCVVIRVLKNKLFAKKGKLFSIGRNVNDYNVLCCRNQSKHKLDLIKLNQRYLYSSFVCKNWITCYRLENSRGTDWIQFRGKSQICLNAFICLFICLYWKLYVWFL